MASLKAYSKLDEADQQLLEACRKTRKRVIIMNLSSIVLIAVIVGTVVGTNAGIPRNNSSGGGIQSLSTSVKAICDLTLYPESCHRSLRPVLNRGHIQPQDLYMLSVQVAINELSKASRNFNANGRFRGGITDKMTLASLESCHELLDLALDHLIESFSHGGLKFYEAVDDLRTWLSSAGTYQQTCIDGLDDATKTKVSEYLQSSTEFTSNSLAIITEFSKLAKSFKLRTVLSGDGDVPRWLSSDDRRLLESCSSEIEADAVVAQDGYEQYSTISAALKAVPNKSKERFVIYVKKGVYEENVKVEKNKWNVMMVGDGKDATIITGSLNVVDGTQTFKTATFAAFGKGFMARDIGFYNTAGPAKHQAVALMSNSDQSAFYRCRVDGFQDSLYAHANRQFYRECDIYGTVDFIFGNSAVVIQNCNIFPRKPMHGQQNAITAQGKIDPNQNTGISIQNCTIRPFGDLSGVKTYLGRPWKNYSTTVYIHSDMDSIVHPKGWLPWVGDSAPDTIFYAEFENSGTGSSTENRVKWKGLRSISRKEAKKFSVKYFIDGNRWLTGSGINYKPGI